MWFDIFYYNKKSGLRFMNGKNHVSDNFITKWDRCAQT